MLGARANRVIPLRNGGLRFEVDHRSFFLGWFLFRGVLCWIKFGDAGKAVFGGRGADELQNLFHTVQRFARPIRTDQTEHAMFDPIPFRRS